MTVIVPDVSATSFPAFGRRPVPVAVAVPRPRTVPGVFRAAARLIATNGHHQGDYLPDPFNHQSRTPHATRPLSIVAALRCAVSGLPHQEMPLSELAVSALASRLDVDGMHAPDDPVLCQIHIAAWGDVEGRTTQSVCAVLYAAADAVEVTS